jgi:hypothetical protein
MTNKLNDSYAKDYSPTEHLAPDEIIVLCKLESLQNSIYRGNTKGFVSKFTKFVFLRDICIIQVCI